MTPQERQMLDGLFERVRTAANGPRDAEAERYIADAARATPSAAYVLAQTVLVQQQALENAAKHIQDLESRGGSGGAGGEPTSFLGNLGRSLFGGGPSAPQPPTPDPRTYNSGYAPQQRPAYAPPPQQAGPWGGAAAAPAAPAQGGGFLSGAVQTATGVAGGMLLGNALGGLFGGHGGGLFGGGMGGGGYGRGETVNETVNNYYADDPAGQHAQDVLQDMDQDQDTAQDSGDYSGGGGDDNA